MELKFIIIVEDFITSLSSIDGTKYRNLEKM